MGAGISWWSSKAGNMEGNSFVTNFITEHAGRGLAVMKDWEERRKMELEQFCHQFSPQGMLGGLVVI